MGYVSARNFYAAFVLCAAVLSGCKEPTMQVASLGKQLPKPALTSNSPFDQDIDSTGYVHFEGTCDSRLTDLSLSFDMNNWQSPPAQPDLSATPGTNTFTNDINCSDGVFSFYLSPKDILLLWNLNVGSDEDDDVDYIYIRGWSLIGYSETLTLKNDRPDKLPAERVVLEKTWPRGFAGSEQCEYFEVRVQNSAGYKATHNLPITFTLDKKLDSTITSGIAAHLSWDDCNSNTNAQTTFSIPANESSVTVFYRFPASPIDTNFGFRIGSASALNYSPDFISVMLRDSTSATQRWVGLHEFSHQIYKNQCVPFKLQRMTYAKAPDNSPYDDVIDLMAPTSALKFYTDSDCTNLSSSLTFTPYSALAEGYIKYTPSASESGFIELTVQATSRAGNSLQYDIPSMRFTVDLTAKTSLARIGSRSTNSMANGQCHAVSVTPENENGSLIAADTDLPVQLETAQTGIGTYYAGSTCTTPISSTTIPQGAISSTVYFKPSVNVAGKYQLRFTSGNIVTTGHDIEMTLAATKFQLFVAPLLADSCIEVQVKLTDHLGNYFVANQYYNPSITTSGISFSTLHLDVMCTSPASSTVMIPAGSDRATFYIKSQGLSGTSFSLQVNPVPGMEGDVFNGSF